MLPTAFCLLPSVVYGMWLIVGLGNPGRDYAGTYHNVGFRVLRRIADPRGIRIDRACGPARVSRPFALAGRDVILVLPLTYMNRSGLPLPSLFDCFESAAGCLIVICDDLALPLGKMRIRQKGSAGGHNGLKSVISVIGSEDFARVRVGIRPEREIGEAADFVLSPVAKTDRNLLDRVEEAAARAVVSILSEGVRKAMSHYNGIDLREAESEEE